MPRTRTKKVYLTDDEKKVLRGLLEEWNGKPDKNSRDSFVSAEALPKIQQLNLAKFSSDIIARDKAAKILWDLRVQVCISQNSKAAQYLFPQFQAVYTWFKNNKPLKDRAVFKLERKIPLRRVVGKLKAEELSLLVKTMAPDIEKGDKRYPGHFQKALTRIMEDLTDEEMEEMEAVRDEWQATGPPIDVRLKQVPALLLSFPSEQLTRFQSRKEIQQKGYRQRTSNPSQGDVCVLHNLCLQSGSRQRRRPGSMVRPSFNLFLFKF
jgi:signal recognition particle subunit SEC65